MPLGAALEFAYKGGVDIAGKDLKAARCHAQRIGEGDRQRIGLLPGRGRRAPDAILAGALTRMLSQHRKVVRFAEKRGEVGGQ